MRSHIIWLVVLASCATVMSTAQIDRLGMATGHIVTTTPAGRFIVGQTFAGTSSGATLGFLPLRRSTPSSVARTEQGPEIMLTPMPAHDVCTVRLEPCADRRTYAIVDGAGRSGAEGSIEPGSTHCTIIVSQLTTGVYSLVVRTSSRTSVVPIVIVR